MNHICDNEPSTSRILPLVFYFKHSAESINFYAQPSPLDYARPTKCAGKYFCENEALYKFIKYIQVLNTSFFQ